MMATTTRAAALTDWREQIGILMSVAGASALAIAGVLIAIVRSCWSSTVPPASG